jgi:flagellar motor switch protein FliM
MTTKQFPRQALPNGADEPLVSIGEATIDRMPGLIAIFEEASTKFTRFLNQYGEGAVALALEGMGAARVGDLAEKNSDFGRILVFRAAGLGSKMAVAVDEGFRSLTFELLLGSSIVERASNRPLTRIEDRIINFTVMRMLSNVADAFSAVAQVDFERDALAEEGGFSGVAPKGTVAVLVRLSLQYREHFGKMLVALPRAALDPYRTILSRLPGAEGQANDEKWSENLYDNIVRTEVTADVKIEARGFTLGDIARLEVGDVLRLAIAPTSPIRVVSEGRTLFWCTLGQKDGYYTVRLEEFSDERESFIENILGV